MMVPQYGIEARPNIPGLGVACNHVDLAHVSHQFESSAVGMCKVISLASLSVS